MLKLEYLEVYKLSMEFGENIWDIVTNWDHFLKETIGKQLELIHKKLNGYIKSIGKSAKPLTNDQLMTNN